MSVMAHKSLGCLPCVVITDHLYVTNSKKTLVDALLLLVFLTSFVVKFALN